MGNLSTNTADSIGWKRYEGKRTQTTTRPERRTKDGHNKSSRFPEKVRHDKDRRSHLRSL